MPTTGLISTVGKSSPANQPSRANCSPCSAGSSANPPCPRVQAAPTPACMLSPRSPAFSFTHASRPPIFVRALNRALPGSIRVLDAQIVPDTFHARHSAVAKTYEYRVLPIEPACHQICPPFLARYVYPYSWPLDFDNPQCGRCNFPRGTRLPQFRRLRSRSRHPFRRPS